MIHEYGLYNVPFGATHHATCTGIWLDVVLIDSANKLLAFEKSKVPFICNHDYLIVDYKLEPLVFNKRPVCTRDFRKFDSDFFSSQFKLQIESSSFTTFVLKDPNLFLEGFQSIALRLLDEQAPFSERVIKKNPAPWFNTASRLRCRERDKLYYELTNVQVLQVATAALPKCKGHSFDRLQLNYFKECLCVV